MELSFHQVTKFYGPVVGLNEVSFEIGPGITGLFGANGAGKSTLMKLASGQLRPTLGSVSIGELPTWKTSAKHHLGYTPDLDRFYEKMKVRHFLQLIAKLHGFRPVKVKEATEQALHRVGMTDRAEKRLGGCSRGMRQRVQLAQALIHDPEILLLDEPMSGIDPAGRQEITAILRGLASDGKTILLSSHLLQEVEPLAQSILMIARGRLVAAGPLSEIREQLDQEPLTIELISTEPRRLSVACMQMDSVQSVTLQRDRILLRTNQASEFYRDLQATVVAEKFEITRYDVLDAGAEAVFQYLDRRAP
ncbi:Gliding motility-associated ABC transporter ATP-binding subunit GldA [Planctomycetales bacterium 10988]|nr:Gliding motility-associated ABC transporter ATP-binding subunit GldA [Planctomycetales bacterium 10988]